MKRAGELLSAFFDEEILKKAQGYHNLFSSWKSIAGDQISAHSRIVELERSVLHVETDHPGWIQILQMKQRSLLNGVRRRFPELSINGISFHYSRDPGRGFGTPERQTDAVEDKPEFEESPRDEQTVAKSDQNIYENISDPAFKEILMRLEQSNIAKARKARKSNSDKSKDG